MEATLNSWKKKNTVILKNFDIDGDPKKLIRKISEDILATFSETDLIDKYDIYEHLMVYWSETMQDDAYMIADYGWKAELAPVEGKKGEVECDLMQKYLVINRYFAREKQATGELEIAFDNATRELEELVEKNGGDEGYFTGFDKINKASVASRIKEIKGNRDDAEEMKVLEKCLALMERESDAKKKIKEADKALDEKVIAKYKTLTEAEIKTLVADDKWMATIEQAVKGEMDRISQRLTQRIKELAERYDTPLPKIVSETEALTSKVDAHLNKMGFTWK